MTNQTDQKAYTTLDNCVACGGDNLYFFLDLAEQPLANNYHNGSGGGDSYPLGLNLCKDCFHTQIPVSVDPKIMFEHYLYVTGTSQTMRDYSDWVAEKLTEKHIDSGKTVLDIASNDGTQLDSFKKFGWKTYGVDPAKNLAEVASKKGHNIQAGFWPVIHEQMDVVLAQNVLAHGPTPLEFLQGVRECLKPDGSAYIQTSQSQMYQRNEFDTAYHEHISFFSVNSMTVLADRAGLVLTDVELTPVHGDSYFFTLKHKGSQVESSVQEMINKELQEGRHEPEFYTQFGKNAYKILKDLKEMIELFKQNGTLVVGYGAAAKGITVLKANDIILDWIVDDNELKQGLFTPGTNIPVKDRSSLDIDDEILLVPLAWNFFDEIKSKVSEIRANKPTKYLRYFPEVREG